METQSLINFLFTYAIIILAISQIFLLWRIINLENKEEHLENLLSRK